MKNCVIHQNNDFVNKLQLTTNIYYYRFFLVFIKVFGIEISYCHYFIYLRSIIINSEEIASQIEKTN